jgi:tRNA (guanine-N7-)-methyltransferase
MRARQHVNPLGLSFETFRGEHPRLVPGRPVEVEVGCADAQFLFERAAEDPDRVYLGFEIRDHLVDEVNERAAEEGAPVQAIFANANLHLRSLLPEAGVSRFFLNFPDPWFKRRHRKRRMIDEVLVDAIAHLIEPDGEVLVQSDVWDVALDALELFERRDDVFANMAGSWSFWRDGNPFQARSWRETHCTEEGLPIWRIRYRAGRHR